MGSLGESFGWDMAACCRGWLRPANESTASASLRDGSPGNLYLARILLELPWIIMKREAGYAAPEFDGGGVGCAARIRSRGSGPAANPIQGGRTEQPQPMV